MKSSDLNLGDILAFRSRSSSSRPVMVLDTSLWTLGNEWVPDPTSVSHAKMEVFNFRPAMDGERAKDGDYRNNYRDTGIPLLKIEADHHRWMDETSERYRIITPVRTIFREVTDQLQLKRASDVQGHRPKSSGRIRVNVDVDLANGEKSFVQVILIVARPQTLIGSWDSVLSRMNDEENARRAMNAEREQADVLRKELGADVALRLDSLFGEGKRFWAAKYEREDCRTDSGSRFLVGKGLLLQLLELAEKNSQS